MVMMTMRATVVMMTCSFSRDSEIVNVESEDTPSLFIPLCWDDQFMTAKVKVVKPRLPSAQPSSDVSQPGISILSVLQLLTFLNSAMMKAKYVKQSIPTILRWIYSYHQTQAGMGVRRGWRGGHFRPPGFW